MNNFYNSTLAILFILITFSACGLEVEDTAQSSHPQQVAPEENNSNSYNADHDPNTNDQDRRSIEDISDSGYIGEDDI